MMNDDDEDDDDDDDDYHEHDHIHPLLFSDGDVVFNTIFQKQVLESHGGIWSAKVDPVSANGPLPNP